MKRREGAKPFYSLCGKSIEAFFLVEAMVGKKSVVGIFTGLLEGEGIMPKPSKAFMKQRGQKDLIKNRCGRATSGLLNIALVSISAKMKSFKETLRPVAKASRLKGIHEGMGIVHIHKWVLVKGAYFTEKK